MDVDLLSRHFAHIGARVQVRSDGGRSRRMAREGGVTLDVVQDRFGELFECGSCRWQSRGSKCSRRCPTSGTCCF